MTEDWEYVSLSKRFESFATRATDPKLAAAYRSLAKYYRILDRWREKLGNRYETGEFTPPERPSDEATSQEGLPEPPRRLTSP